MTIVLTILQALIALPKIGGLIKQLIDAITAYRNEEKRKELEDVTIEIKNAKDKEARDAAIKRWSNIVSS